MRINVGLAKANLSALLARAEAGEEIEIARDGVPVARLSRIERPQRRGDRFLDGWGTLAGELTISDDFEFSDQELDEMYGEWDEEDGSAGTAARHARASVADERDPDAR